MRVPACQQVAPHRRRSRIGAGAKGNARPHLQRRRPGPAWRSAVALLLALACLSRAGPTKYVTPRVSDFIKIMRPMDACLWASASASDQDAPQGNCGHAAAAYYCAALGAYLVNYELAAASGITMRTTEVDLDRQLCLHNCTTFAFIECSDAPVAGALGLCKRRPAAVPAMQCSTHLSLTAA